jgi:Flp pilus assembly CpaF family ATPase
MPSGGIVLHAPVRDRIGRARVNGRIATPAPDGRTLAIREFPAEVLLESTTT